MNYPVPAWRPVRTVVTDWFVNRMAHYTDRRKGFVVYKHGTVVFDDSPAGPNIIACNASLQNVVRRPPDFSVMPMRDGNFLIIFRDPVFGLVDGTFVKQNLKQLLSDAIEFGLLPNETLLQKDKKAIQDCHHAVGLYARANLYLDAESPVVVSRFSPHA